MGADRTACTVASGSSGTEQWGDSTVLRRVQSRTQAAEICLKTGTRLCIVDLARRWLGLDGFGANARTVGLQMSS